ncbi:hypothetical protein [Actinotalea subterranea]|uniref:hypothetical protein n=1 Tax=Actinotalea subterranea TaxID=2607497 RepID=UPI0011EEEDB2|nr:hypothetical protein [Actinotalea subterranea]
MSVHLVLNAAETAERLRAWAAGSHPLVAAVELLVRAFDGRFAQPGQPWIRIEANGYVWLDDEVLHAGLGPLSSGERRVLDVVCALAEPSRTLHLADALVGLDRRHLDLVLAACAHAAGSHEHAELSVDPATREVRVRHLGSAHPWPTTARPDPALLSTSPPDRTI